MISVTEATNIILENARNFGSEIVHISECVGRRLDEDIVADRDFPPFDRVAMDGICIRYEDFQNGQRQFEIQDTQAAGSEKLTLANRCAIEIMTGATLSNNADVVIRYEDISIESNIATVNISQVKQFQNVHGKGSDNKTGDVLVPRDTIINSAVIGVLATVGKQQIKVKTLPKIAIISTGDELVEINETPSEYQIRKSNVYSLETLLKNQNIIPDKFHLSDSKSEIEEALSTILRNYDAVLMSGAVSKGKFDFLPDVLEKLGVEKLFHRVAQRPGKPFWFGKRNNTSVFAFPGNPVSTYVCAIRYFIPWLTNIKQQHFAILAEDFDFKPELTNFLQVKITNIAGCLHAQPYVGNGSGDLANLVQIDALMELPSSVSHFKKGTAYPIWYI